MFISRLKFDAILSELNYGLQVGFGPAKPGERLSPAIACAKADAALSSSQCKQSEPLMRINHTGEVCAQALYRGQAFVSKTAQTQTHLLNAAAEEQDHLYWCEQRINTLGGRPSLLNPFWYMASWLIGAGSGLLDDKHALGFVVETERQVEEHINSHLDSLPAEDKSSRAILEQMRLDEIAHGQAALDAGGVALPKPVKILMTAKSKIMKAIVRYI